MAGWSKIPAIRTTFRGEAVKDGDWMAEAPEGGLVAASAPERGVDPWGSCIPVVPLAFRLVVRFGERVLFSCVLNITHW